jgi:hypothetical protein
MLRVLTLSTLFPNRAQPVLGPFVERQTIGLAEHPGVGLEVVAPIGVPPSNQTLVPRPVIAPRSAGRGRRPPPLRG